MMAFKFRAAQTGSRKKKLKKKTMKKYNRRLLDVLLKIAEAGKSARMKDVSELAGRFRGTELVIIG